MYLKSLTLKGFKSFADTTTLHLEPGITVVVGPNGSGKSNVVDAVAWVLGAQGPRALRSTKMDDVIFAGTAKRPALGRAEVSLTVDNTSGMLPIDFAEVTISRTLFRSGASEYAINSVPCRLLDIQELLSDSGVGRTQHVIVGQGQLEAVLEARPEERRAVIEEAAGVLKFRRRKEKAERRLAATEGNLVRLSDLVREVRRQLRPLERQAEATRRHGSLVEELHALRVHLAGRELAALARRRHASEEVTARLDAEERSARSELARLDVDVEQASAELAAVRANDLSEALVQVERLAAQGRGLAAVLAERRRGVERDRASGLDATVVATLEAEAGRLQAELAAVDEEAGRLAPDVERLADAEAEMDEQWAVLDAQSADHGPEPADVAARARAELAALVTAAERGEAECARARVRLATLEERRERQAMERRELDARRGAAQADGERLGPVLDAARRSLADAESLVAEAEAALRAADADHHGCTARAEALAAALDEARARSGAERLAGVAEVAGTLLELVDVDPGWEGAFEAAAEPALGAVVVSGGRAGAHRCLESLRDSGPGTVLGLGIERPAPAPPPAGESVRAHVRGCSPDVDQLLDALVGGAVCVGGEELSAWKQALDTTVAHPGAVVVTLAGDRFAAEGWRVGGRPRGATRAALDDARTAAAAAGDAIRAAEERLRTAREGLDRARAAEAEVGRELQHRAATLATTTDAVERMEREAEATVAEAEELRSELVGLQATVERERRRSTDLTAALADLETEERRSTERRDELDARRRALQERAGAVAALRTDVEVRAGALADRRAWLHQRLADVDARLSGNLASRRQAEARRAELDARLRALDRLAALVAERVDRLEPAVATLRERRRRTAERTRAGTEHLESLRRRRVAADHDLEELRERAVRAGMEAQELALRAEAAAEAVRRDLDVDPDTAAAAPCPPLPDGTTAAARARDLERELRSLGPVNPLALDEANLLRERQAFLEGQLDDVKESRRQLAKVIRAVDAEIVEVFVAAFADVAENFARLFAMLFPGGQGRLELTEPGNPLETGIRVRARPSGKNIRSVSLLSGGERSLTALAYLFAVFRSRPSPFYVLDEVEAALDDVNLHRFLDLVHEFRREAQLLIVSHQQRTMETADVLYGVTMAPGGASGVVSERVTTSTG